MVQLIAGNYITQKTGLADLELVNRIHLFKIKFQLIAYTIASIIVYIRLI